MHSILADSAISFFALIGLLAVLATVRLRHANDGLATRVLFAARLVALLMAVRILAWNFDAWIWRASTMVLASWVPFAALIVMEGLLRRHAPKWLKIAGVAGAGIFSVAGVTGWLGFGIPLLTFQFIGLVSVTWLAATRDKASLSSAENAVVQRIAFAMPFLLVLLASDFGMLEHVVPVRISGMAILILCWMTLGANGDTSRRASLVALTAVLLLSGIAGGVAAMLSAVDVSMAVRMIAVVMSSGLLVLTIYDALRMLLASRRDGVMKAVVDVRDSDPSTWLAAVAARSGLDARPVDETILSSYDVGRLRKAFADKPVMVGDDASLPWKDDDARQQVESLFMTYDATHLMMLSSDPLRLAALTVPSVGTDPWVNDEIALIRRVAELTFEDAKTCN